MKDAKGKFYESCGELIQAANDIHNPGINETIERIRNNFGIKHAKPDYQEALERINMIFEKYDVCINSYVDEKGNSQMVLFSTVIDNDSKKIEYNSENNELELR